MKSKNAILFKNVFPWKETRENCSFKRTIQANPSNYYQLEDDEVEFRKSKRIKTTKIFSPNFLIYL